MNWFLLLLGLVSAGLTYNVRHPIQRGFRARAFGFFAGWLWGELAPHIIAVQVLLVVAFAAGGAIEGFAGVVGLLLVAGSCGVLANIYLESGKAGAIVERALRDGLGDSYEEAIDADLRAKFERGVRVRPLLLPFSFTRPEVETIKDIRFAREKGVDLKLDIARHRMVPEKSPVLLQIHGGGWTIGYKENQAVPLMTQLASRGWVCVNVDYRLSPHATFPEHLIDCKMAIKWIRENIERYGGDPDFIVATGGSAGGHLSARFEVSSQYCSMSLVLLLSTRTVNSKSSSGNISRSPPSMSLLLVKHGAVSSFGVQSCAFAKGRHPQTRRTPNRQCFTVYVRTSGIEFISSLL
jgi:hypothetical protein